MAYVTLLSIVPSLAAVLSIVAIFKPFFSGNFDAIQHIREFILNNLAAGSGEEAVKVIDDLLSKLSFTKIGVSSFVGLLVSLVLLLRQVEIALNKIWLVPKGRNVFIRFIYFWTFLTLGTFLGTLAIGYFSKIGLSAALDLEGSKSIFSYILETLYGYLSGYVIFLFLFKFVPNIHVPFKKASIGAMVATVLLDFAGIGFSWYVTSFSSHRVVYGALAALPLFLLWLYICWLIILFGALVSWRFTQGFKDAENDYKVLHPKNKSDYFFSRKLESVSPLICLIDIARMFWKDSTNPITAFGMEKRLDLPSSWIHSSIELLKEKGLIKQVENNELEAVYIPSVPLEKLEIQNVYQLFEIDPSDFLKHAEEVITEESSKMTLSFLKKYSSTPNMKFVEFLESF